MTAGPAGPTDLPPRRPPAPDRQRGMDRMQEVYGFNGDPDIGPGDFMAYTVDHLFGDVWYRPGLDLLARRLLAIGVLAAQGQPDLPGHPVRRRPGQRRARRAPGPRGRHPFGPLRGLAARGPRQQRGRGVHSPIPQAAGPCRPSRPSRPRRPRWLRRLEPSRRLHRSLGAGRIQLAQQGVLAERRQRPAVLGLDQAPGMGHPAPDEHALMGIEQPPGPRQRLVERHGQRQHAGRNRVVRHRRTDALVGAAWSSRSRGAR